MYIDFGLLATGALEFTLALAWNDAVSKTIKSFIPPTERSAEAWATIIYAIMVTILIILITILVNRTVSLAQKIENKRSFKPHEFIENTDMNGRPKTVKTVLKIK